MGFFDSKEAEIKKTSTLSPEQQQLMEGIGAYFESRVGQGLPGWEGSFTAPMSDVESTGMNLLREYAGGGVGDAGQLGIGAYKEALAGMDPKAVAEQYMKYTAPAEQRYLTETLLPTFKESQVPGGTLRSTGTERGLGDIISKFGEGQLGRIGERITSEREGARSMIPYTGQMSALEGGVPQMEAALKYGQLPRMIEQAELTAQIQEFVRTTPEMSPLLDKMLNYMGIQTQAAFLSPYQPSPFLTLAGSAIEAAGSAAGAYFGAGGGGGGATAPAG